MPQNIQRQAQSRQLVETGYLDWLCSEIGNLARSKFEAAGVDDVAALSRAKIAFELVAEVGQIVKSNAQQT